MNSAPVTLPCTSSTTATGGSARAMAVKARRQTVAASRRLMADLDHSLAPEQARRFVRQLMPPSEEQREAYHTRGILRRFRLSQAKSSRFTFTYPDRASRLLRAVIAEAGIALVELRLHAAAVAAEGRHI